MFWLLCSTAACLCMGGVTLWLGQVFGSFLPALFVSAAAYCLPPLLALSGMENGIQWLGTWPLFHAAALLTVQGYGGPEGTPYTLAWAAVLLLLLALAAAWALGQSLLARYEYAGIDLAAEG